MMKRLCSLLLALLLTAGLLGTIAVRLLSGTRGRALVGIVSALGRFIGLTGSSLGLLLSLSRIGGGWRFGHRAEGVVLRIGHGKTSWFEISATQYSPFRTGRGRNLPFIPVRKWGARMERPTGRVGCLTSRYRRKRSTHLTAFLHPKRTNLPVLCTFRRMGRTFARLFTPRFPENKPPATRTRGRGGFS